MKSVLINPFLSAVLLLGLLSVPAHSEWGPVSGTSGYQGEFYLGGSHRSENERHNTDISIGVTQGIIGGEFYQLNLKYVYSPYIKNFKKFSTNFIGVGALLTRCLCDDVFIENVDPYPEGNYYDETAYRSAVVFSSKIYWKDVEIYWDWLLLDQILIAYYNNPNMRNQPLENWSAGVGLRLFTDF